MEAPRESGQGKNETGLNRHPGNKDLSRLRDNKTVQKGTRPWKTVRGKGGNGRTSEWGPGDEGFGTAVADALPVRKQQAE